MKKSTPSRNRAELARTALPVVQRLADILVSKQEEGAPVVVVVVGAGASSSAGIPASTTLVEQIYERLVANTERDDPIRTLFKEETQALTKDATRGLADLPIFQFAHVVSRFAYGRRVLREVLRDALLKAKLRPLCYELLAHLAKHRFVDHFVSFNFDELLDEALRDEVDDRLRIISSPEDILATKAIDRANPPFCFLVKPFGTLSRDTFKLASDEIAELGPERVREFLSSDIFAHPAGKSHPDLVIILAGYGANEAAFVRLIGELRAYQDRNVTIFSISRSAPPQESIQRLSTEHIALDADDALGVVLDVMESRVRKRERTVWIPVARHRLIAECVTQHQLNDYHGKRFAIEIILQALKSRGFFAAEAVADIDRLRRYAGNAYRMIQRLHSDGVLHAQPYRHQREAARHLIPDYWLTDDKEKVIAAFLSDNLPDPRRKIERLVVTEKEKGGLTVKSHTLTVREYVRDLFREIESGPEIEIAGTVDPATAWLFGDSRTKKLSTMRDLVEATYDVVEFAIRAAATGPVKLRGIWTTGEWLFHENGWAWESLGRRLLKLLQDNGRDRFELSLVLVRLSAERDLRSRRAKEVRDTLETARADIASNVYELDWWQHNRIVTLVETADGDLNSGIYMRRRHATPLVSPWYVTGSDCEVLGEMFEHYVSKAKRVSAPPT